jgi:hypothetical protein
MITNEKALLIIHRDSGMALYSHEFAKGELDPQLLSGFIGAMTSFLSEALNAEESGWKTIYGSDTTLIVEIGGWVTAVLVVLRDNGLLHNKVRLVVAEFENTFQAFKEAACFEGGILDSFDEFVMRVFIDEKVSAMTHIIKKQGALKDMPNLTNPNQPLEVQDVLSMAENDISVETMAQLQDISLEKAREIVMFAYWYNALDLHYIPSDDDILKPTEKSLSTIFSDASPLNLSRDTLFIVGSLDGRIPLGEVFKRWNLEEENIRSELGALVTQGLLQKTTPEHNLILSHENVLNSFLLECKKLVSEQALKIALLTTFLTGIMTHPWLSRVQIHDEFHLECQIDENMTSEDYGDLYDALQYVINEIGRKLSTLSSEERIKEALVGARAVNQHMEMK